jgi:hypothetical protein
MFKMFARARRKRRAERYLQLHPEDVAAVGPILFALDRLEPKSARDVAEMRAGHRLSDVESNVERHPVICKTETCTLPEQVHE